MAVAIALLGGSGSTADAGPAGSIAASTGSPAARTAIAASAAPLPACADGDVLAPNRGYEEWATTILDRTFMLPSDYVPPDLVPVTDAGIEGRGKVRSLVIDDLRSLAAAARAGRVSIRIDSAYRSFDQQVASYESYVTGYGEEPARLTVARPGHSEHQLGTTIDVVGDVEWLADHGPRFGFVMSYPPGRSPARTCYRHEDWHYRYVGRAMAAEVQASGLSLREWLWANRR
ncbi:MAG TPA: M15 family metallopeptidase [Candidatus Limnocylindrales bacterium]|nr:M15 family metallopeptidase [Candidatus Limnocylindrales bacterium]